MSIWFFDSWLVGKCEKFAHWFQRETGKTNYFLERACWWLIILVVTFFYSREGWDAGKVIVLLIYLYIATVTLPLVEKTGLSINSCGLSNPMKINLFARTVRIAACIYFAWNTVLFTVWFSKESLYDCILSFFFVFTLYFATCDPLPPCRGKLWEKISAFFATPVISGSRG